MNKNHLKILTAGILSTVLLGVSTPAVALETPKTATQNTEADQPVSVSNTHWGNTQQDAPWGLDRIDQRDLPLDGTFATEVDAGKGVSIYVIDSGIRSTHDDFTTRVDGGYFTSRVAKGWNAVNGNDDTSACGYHGTHVAGIAAGNTYGVAKSATIIPVKIVDNNCDERFEALINGLTWVKEHHQEGTPAVVNLSVIADGGNESIDNAVKALIDEGITVVAGAGNNGIDACTVSPARIPEAITVAASTRDDKPWDGGKPGWNDTSNFGSCVDIYAPGKDILSAGYNSDTAPYTESGTSMAAPYVAGAAAVILSRYPKLTPAEVTAAIINSSSDGRVTGVTPETTSRLLFLSQSAAPSAPTYINARPTDYAGQAGVSWNGGPAGGSEISYYTVHAYKAGIKQGIYYIPAKDNTNTSISGLTPGETYTFSVTATNAIGTSPESAHSSPVIVRSTDATAPAAPTNVSASVRFTPGEANIHWTPSSDDGGTHITRQELIIYEDGVRIASREMHPDMWFIGITGLSQGKTHTFTVIAINSMGTSPESAHSNPVTIVREAPPFTAPSNVTATPLVGGATINWTQGSDGGSDLTSQRIIAYIGDSIVKSMDVSGAETTANMSDLENGQTYTFSVSATNEIGTSPESPRSAPITTKAEAPSAPIAIRAAPVTTGGSANVYWDASYNGGSAITSYEITVYNGVNVVKTVKALASSRGVYITGLYNGTNYHFTIKAINSVGTSPESNATNTINPIAVAPAAPANARASASTDAGAANVYWDAASDNGSAITSYEITVYNGLNVIKTAKVPASYKAVKIRGLYNGTDYHFTIKAINSVGTSSESNNTNTINPIAAAPGTATNVRAVAGDNNADIYWTRGSENGAPLTSQIITIYSGTTKIRTATLSSTSSSVRVTGATEGREYQYTITEVNQMGSSPESAKTNIVTPF